MRLVLQCGQKWSVCLRGGVEVKRLQHYPIKQFRRQSIVDQTCEALARESCIATSPGGLSLRPLARCCSKLHIYFAEAGRRCEDDFPLLASQTNLSEQRR